MLTSKQVDELRSGDEVRVRVSEGEETVWHTGTVLQVVAAGLTQVQLTTGLRVMAGYEDLWAPMITENRRRGF